MKVIVLVFVFLFSFIASGCTSKEEDIQAANKKVIGDTKSPLFDRKNHKNVP